MNLIFYHFNCFGRLLKFHHVFLVPVVAACSQFLLKSVSKLFENVEWSNSLLRHFKIQTLLKINCCMAAISAFGGTQHSQIFSLFFRNRIQCIALYQLHNSQALLNLRRGYFNICLIEILKYIEILPLLTFWVSSLLRNMNNNLHIQGFNSTFSTRQMRKFLKLKFCQTLLNYLLLLSTS